MDNEYMQLLRYIQDRTEINGFASVDSFNTLGRQNCAHLMQVGVIGFNFDKAGYYITGAGIQAIKQADRQNDPVFQQQQRDREIQGLRDAIREHEDRLPQLRAQLAKLLGEHSNPTDAQIMRLIGDDFQNGE